MHQTSQTQEINKQIKRSVSLLKVIEVSGNFNRSHTYTNTHTLTHTNNKYHRLLMLIFFFKNNILCHWLSIDKAQVNL